jgi:hypothetical protein
MSYQQSYEQVMQSHMEQLRNWMVSTPITTSIPFTAISRAPIPDDTFYHQPLYEQMTPRGMCYYDCQPPTLNTQYRTLPVRAHTFHSGGHHIYGDPQVLRSPCVRRAEPAIFDDYEALSCYSESPGSLVSSDVTDHSVYDNTFLTASRRTMSVTSQPGPRPQPQPVSEVDTLMQSIQPSAKPSPTPVLPMASIKHVVSIKSKKHACPYVDCNKSFSQPTHLRIHLRSHTGEKPYTCSIATCRQTFSQLGNLRTHERRHIGQRPNRKRTCSDPGQRGKRYECILDDCKTRITDVNGQEISSGKVFTQLGNLKAHMNKFHKDTLARLSSQLACPSDDDRELKEYFTSLFRNSNKGIKGRGKGRKVEVIVDQAICHEGVD